MHNITPFASASSKIKASDSLSYFKINLSESQMKVFDHKTKKVNSYFSDMGYSFNQPEFFKVLLMNFDNVDFMRVMVDLYASDCSTLFHKSKTL